MKLEQSFEVQAPVEEVWNALLDIDRIAPCLPGADITGHDDDGNYTGTFKIKLGPTTANYRGRLRIGEVDEAARRATLHARGTDKRGQGGANATIVNTLEAVDGGTRVHAETDFAITGRLASFSRSGMIKDISNRLLNEFSSCLQQELAAAPEPVVAAPPSTAAGDGGGGSADAGRGAGGAAAPDWAASSATTASAARSGTPAAASRPRPQARPIQGGSLFIGVIWDRIRQWVNRRRFPR